MGWVPFQMFFLGPFSSGSYNKGETRGQEAIQGDQCAEHRTDAGLSAGTRQDIQARLPQCDCGEEDDLPQ